MLGQERTTAHGCAGWVNDGRREAPIPSIARKGVNARPWMDGPGYNEVVDITAWMPGTRHYRYHAMDGTHGITNSPASRLLQANGALAPNHTGYGAVAVYKLVFYGGRGVQADENAGAVAQVVVQLDRYVSQGLVDIHNRWDLEPPEDLD